MLEGFIFDGDLTKASTTPISTTPALERQVGGDHYKNLAIQPSEYIMKNNLGWCEGNAIKYITRYKQKGQAADIEKAIHYLQIILEDIKNGS